MRLRVTKSLIAIFISSIVASIIITVEYSEGSLHVSRTITELNDIQIKDGDLHHSRNHVPPSPAFNGSTKNNSITQKLPVSNNVMSSHKDRSSNNVQSQLSDIDENNIKIMRERAADLRRRCQQHVPPKSAPGRVKRYIRVGSRAIITNARTRNRPPPVHIRKPYLRVHRTGQHYANRNPNTRRVPSKESSTIKGYYRTTGVPFIYVAIPKCGWSTWMHIMFDAAGKHKLLLDSFSKGITGLELPINKVGLKFLNTPTKANSIIDTERVLGVRNPYDRLISAYKYRILNPNRTMCRRVPGAAQRGPDTFPKFIDCLLYHARKSHQPVDSYGAQWRIDQHFRIQAYQSSPCSVNYTLVVHMESFDSEVQTLISYFKLNTTVFKENISKTVKNKDSDYLKELNEKQLNGLREFLKLDFDIFGYDPNLLDF